MRENNHAGVYISRNRNPSASTEYLEICVRVNKREGVNSIMESFINAINNRVSIRNYTDQPVEPDKRSTILDLLRTTQKGPFGNKVRLELIDLDEMEKKEIKSLGTYGVITGARLYIVSAVDDTNRAMEDIGYCFEKVILSATNLGLGTCWMGGTFKRASFAKKINVAENETVPAVSPIGYAHEKRTIKDKAIRRFAKSDKRKSWEELFFDGDSDTPLLKANAGKYEIPLECVRLGPSATNFQPWRIIKEKETFHFYLKRTKGYERALKGADLQSIDIGIAMCHFDLSSQELGLGGQWENQEHANEAKNMEYIVTWTKNRGA